MARDAGRVKEGGDDLGEGKLVDFATMETPRRRRRKSRTTVPATSAVAEPSVVADVPAVDTPGGADVDVAMTESTVDDAPWLPGAIAIGLLVLLGLCVMIVLIASSRAPAT